MICSTTHEIPGRRIASVKGIVFGYSLRTRGILGRTKATAEMFVGGKATSYLGEIEKSKNEALADAMKKASELGADGLVGVDFDISEVLEGFFFVSVNGTAVVMEKM